MFTSTFHPIRAAYPWTQLQLQLQLQLQTIVLVWVDAQLNGFVGTASYSDAL